MKLTIAAALIAITATTAQAEQLSAMDICTAWGKTAELVMNSRQIGVPLSTTLTAWDNINQTQYQMVIDAYSTPRYRTPSIVADVIEDFRNIEELKCFDAYGEAA